MKGNFPDGDGQGPDREHLIIIGNGMAPGRMLEHLLEQDAVRFRISIYNAEPRVNYNRLMLSPVLSGEKRYQDIITHDDDWYVAHGIALHKGTPIESIDTSARTVTTCTGSQDRYDRLVIATGSEPIRLPLPGAELPGVLVYRDLDDVEAMLEAAQSSGNAVVIGGGLLGLEAAAGLAEQGMSVTVIHLADTLMERQLDEPAAHLLQQSIEQRNITVLTSAQTQAIIGTDRVSGVQLSDGTRLDADLVVMAVGIRPSTTLARSAGLATERGVLVNDQMCTSVKNVYALGECVEHRGSCYGLVAPLYDMASVLAGHLLGRETSYGGSTTGTKLKVNGVDLYSAGDFAKTPQREEIVLRDASAGIYKRLVLEDEKLVGVVLYGDTVDGAWYLDKIRSEQDLADSREWLIHGQAYAGGAPLDPMEAVAALPDEAEICGCNGVCKGSIVAAITRQSLSTLEAVQAHTKASSSCGTCTPTVRGLLQHTLGDAYTESRESMCPCTDHDHLTVRRAIRERQLRSIPAVLQSLEWHSSCGCARCRPALNYYLVCEWPEDYRDDYQSRFVNERVHANIQKDGTFSVVPRMWGGLTNSQELRAIADVVDRFSIPTVKVTGGQRIDLLGIQKQDLPAVWADLGKAGFVSGHAYAKGLRTVKTCVGEEWCRFGTQDSTGLGVRLEKALWGSWTPAKVKLGVSGCPRNCAEATCKDIGIVCVESGFVVHFAGAAGLDVRATEVLTQLSNETAVFEHVEALLQLYREDAFYLERIHKWARRRGLDWVRTTIVDDSAHRKALQDRFRKSQRVAQTDPWQDRVQGAHAHEFTSLSAKPLQVVA